MKRILSFFLCAVCLCSFASSAAIVTKDTPQIGSSTAATVTVPMGEAVSSEIILAHDSVSHEESCDALLAAAQQRGELAAAINGGSFNASYNREVLAGYGAVAHSYAALVRDGVLVNRGKEQSAVFLGFTEDGTALIDEVGVTLYALFDGRELPTQGVNSYIPEPDTVLLFTPEAGYDLPVPANAKAAKITNGTVVRFLTSGTMTCEPDTYYLVCGKNLYDRLPSLGESVSFRTAFDKPEWADVVTAVSSYPWLLRDGADALEENVRLGYYSDIHSVSDAIAGRSFAAILENGNLMLGVCTASPRQLIQYLLSCHAKDAVLLDGGASSMLYSGGQTLRAASRGLNHILCLYTTEGAEAGPHTAVPTRQQLLIDGKERSAEIYNIDGSNYFKLRDLAGLLLGTGSQFSVDYDETRNTVVIRTRAPYGETESDPRSQSRASLSAVPSTQHVEIDGKPVSLSAYNIGGANYFKLRELGAVLNFDVGYNASTDTILVHSRT